MEKYDLLRKKICLTNLNPSYNNQGSNQLKTMHKEMFNTDEFEAMEWHDCKIYAIAFDETNFLLLIDIDYIFEWIKSETGGNYNFKVSPAILVFENVWNLNIDIDSSLSLDIDEISRSNPRPPKNAESIKKEFEYDWIIQLQQGELSFSSVGFKQIIKKEPIIIDRQNIGLGDRGGIDFNTVVD